MGFRFFVLTSFFGLLYVSLGLKLYQLQVEKGDYYFKKAEARLNAIEHLELRRGQIFFTDRNATDIPVSLNRDYPIIYAVPKEIADAENAAVFLASLVDKSVENLTEDFNNKKSLFKLLVEKASPEQIASIAELNIKGIYSDKKQYRFYPFANLSSHLLGFVGVNEENNEPIGLYGLEKFYNKNLADGYNLKFTIDRNIQVASEEILVKLIKKFEATGGTVIVEDPQSGKILALANYPDFNPNEYGDWPIKNFLNPAVQFVYEPGSVFKPITMATGIDLKVIASSTSFVDTGSVVLNGKTIKNWDEKAHGRVSMTNVIEQSINTGAVFAEQKIGHQKFYEYLKKFGFGETTGVGLPDEVAGSLKNLEKKKNIKDIDFATAAFGQGTAVTPIQMINAFSALANGGLLMRPYVSADEKPYIIRRVISESTSKDVTQMMESAVEKAKIAAIPQYRVAGKTGTAQIPDFKNGGYEDAFVHTYIGFAPAEDAKFVVLIKIDRPNALLAGATVVPAFKELAQFILNYYNIPPDKL